MRSASGSTVSATSLRIDGPMSLTVHVPVSVSDEALDAYLARELAWAGIPILSLREAEVAEGRLYMNWCDEHQAFHMTYVPPRSDSPTAAADAFSVGIWME